MLKKIGIFTLFSFVTAQSIFAFDSTNFNVGVTNLNSETKEIVYNNNGSKLSQLEWKADNVKLLNFGIEGNIKNSLFLSASLATNFDNDDMVMDDYDWVNNTQWTHWSHHDKTQVEDIKMFDANLKYKFEKLPVYVGVGYKAEKFEYSAFDGDYIYSTNGGFRDSTGSFSGLGITFEHTLKMPYLIVGTDFNITKDLNVGADVSYSTFAKFEDQDTHHFRNLVYNDDLDYTNYLGYNIYVNYSITKMIGLGLNYSYNKYDSRKGDTTITNTNSGASSTFEDTAGLEHSNQTITAKLKIKF